MKKQKSKKKLSKVENKQLDAAAKFIAESKKEVLDMAPQTPLAVHSQAEFDQAEFNKA